MDSRSITCISQSLNLLDDSLQMELGELGDKQCILKDGIKEPTCTKVQPNSSSFMQDLNESDSNLPDLNTWKEDNVTITSEPRRVSNETFKELGSVSRPLPNIAFHQSDNATITSDTKRVSNKTFKVLGTGSGYFFPLLPSLSMPAKFSKSSDN